MVNDKRIHTQVVHAGHPEPVEGSVVTPIFQSATYTFRGDLPGEELRYLRYSNAPDQEALCRKLAVLEEAEAAQVTSTGMAAITTTLLSFLSAGDHLLIQDTLYGGTAAFVARDLPRLGIEVSAFDIKPAPTGFQLQRAPELTVHTGDQEIFQLLVLPTRAW